MFPRFPQEIFDYIIDYAPNDGVLKTYSLVCKGWSNRSRFHLFRELVLYKLDSLDRWCKTIPPTVDGPSRHVRDLNIQSGIVPLVFKPEPLDPYLNHFSALTRVANLMLADHRGKLDLDMAFRCFSAFRNSLTYMKTITSSFEFEEISRIAEFFPNLEILSVWGPTLLQCSEKRSLQPPRKASFPRLKVLYLHFFACHPELDNNILAGFAQASMDLEILTVTGKVADITFVQKLLDSCAHSLTELMICPLDLDLSKCEKLRTLEVCELLFAYWACFLRDSLERHRFETMLCTIKSPALRTLCVPVERTWFKCDEIEDDMLPENDWTVVDALLCEVLTRVRQRNPAWSFVVLIADCYFDRDRKPAGIWVERFLPDFRAMGGVVDYTPDRDE